MTIELISDTANAIAASWPYSSVGVEIERGNGHYDARMVFEIDGERYAFDVEAKRQVNVATAASIAQDRDEEDLRQFIFLTEYVQPSVAEALKMRRVNYADTAGNCHIERSSLFIHVEGRRRPRSKEVDPVRAFKGEGLKVIFTLLLQPELVSRPYRDLATLSGASHGVVQYTVKDLERLGFVVRLNQTERRLLNVPGLLDRWATAYAEHLRPKHVMGTFRFSLEDRLRDWHGIDLNPEHERWGSEPAAAIATGYLKPARLTIYSRRTRPDIMERLRVVPDKDGTVEVVRTFWPLLLEENLEARFIDAVVPDILTYADLIATGDPRNAELASMIREQNLGRDAT